MYINFFWSDKLKLEHQSFLSFIQKMANRIMQGAARYGPDDVAKKYFTRLKMEVKAYGKTGNKEHLINIANYALLESLKPENKRFHYDQTVDSVTRGKI